MDRIIQEASRQSRLVFNNERAPWVEIPANYCNDIDRMPKVAVCVAIIGWFATWRDITEPIFCAAAGPEVSEVFPDYEISREVRAAFLPDRRSAIASDVLMRKMGWRIGTHVTLRGSDAHHLEMEFVIVGRYRTGGIQTRY